MARNRLLTRPMAPRRIAIAVAVAGALAVAGCGGGGSSSDGNGGASGAAVTAGRNVSQQSGCTAYHSTDGSVGVGPSFKGLAGRQVTFTDGSTTTADDTYIRESITAPNAKIVKGFSAGVMPATFEDTLSSEQLDQLVEYIKAVK